jgi:hypothetical protein
LFWWDEGVAAAKKKDSSCSVGIYESQRQTRNDGWLELIDKQAKNDAAGLNVMAGWVIMVTESCVPHMLTANSGTVGCWSLPSVMLGYGKQVVFRRDKDV